MDLMDYLFIIVVAGVLILLVLKKTKKNDKESYGEVSETEKGEEVRSKAEKSVADYLHENNIKYKYEETINLGKNKIKYDFYLPKHDIYIEYWGLEGLDNKTGEKYRARKAEKIEIYDEYNLKLISIQPEDLKNLDKIIPRRIKELGSKKSKSTSTVKSLLFGKEGLDQSDPDEEISDEPVFCTKCGNSLPTGSEFCDKCGSSLVQK